MKIRCLPLILLCLLLGGCSRAVSGGQFDFRSRGLRRSTAQSCTPFLPGYTAPGSAEDTLYAEVSRGNAVACFDVQAVPAMRRGVGRYWYPHVLGYGGVGGGPYTDRRGHHRLEQPPGQPQSPVGMSSFSVIRNMLAMGALSYGLNQKEPAKQDALDFLEHLSRNGGFELDGSDAPILICLDYEAAAWNRNGGNYEIIVPEEGTLSFRLGLLSDVSARHWSPGWTRRCCQPACPWQTARGRRAFPAITSRPVR